MSKKTALSPTTIPFATTALLQRLIVLLEAKGALTAADVDRLFKDAADSQPNTDVASFLADMSAELRQQRNG
jgi:hypothetical protein